MENQLPPHVMGYPISSVAYPIKKSPKGYLPDPAIQYHSSSPSTGSPNSKTGKAAQSTISRTNTLEKIADNVASAVREHVKLRKKISEIIKEKLRLGAKILQVCRVDKVFRQIFSVRDGEKFLGASHCFLSTTVGPIAGLLFISSEKVAFCSEKTIKISSLDGKSIRAHYKVVIPLRKIKRASQSENVRGPSEKYIEVVTVDNFDFWFMGFLNYEYDRAFKHLQQAISQS